MSKCSYDPEEELQPLKDGSNDLICLKCLRRFYLAEKKVPKGLIQNLKELLK